MLSLMAPKTEVLFHEKRVTVSGHDYTVASDLCLMVQRVEQSFNLTCSIDIDTLTNRDEYRVVTSWGD
jgi:hypothetical protein